MNENDENPEEKSELKKLLNQSSDHEIAEILANIIADALHENTLLEVSQQFSGPIPPPQVLSGYDQVQPGFAERVMAMAEKEQAHRHGLETQALTSSIAIQKRGQIFALLLSLLILLISGFLIYEGKELAGSAIAGASLTGLAYIFITGRKSKPSENISP